MTADLSTDRWIRDRIDYMPERKAHDYRALDQLRAARRLLSDRMAAKHYVLTLSHRGMMFEATERVLDADLKALDRRIRKLLVARRAAIEQLNGQLSVEGSELTGDFHPAWPDLRYDGGRLTPRGIEVCYRLFDMGRSPMAVAHLMEMSLASARRRAGLWRAAGGQDQIRPELSSIPKVRIRRRLDD